MINKVQKIVLFLLIASSIVLWLSLLNSDYVARGICLENGYPNYQVHGDKYYCIRLVDGNQVVINVDDLEPK